MNNLFYYFLSKFGRGGEGGDGDMRKSIYDVNSSGVVDNAEQLNDGTNSVTPTEARTHLDNTNKHNTQVSTGFINSVLITDNGLGNFTVNETDALIYTNDSHSGNLLRVTFPSNSFTLTQEQTFYLVGDYNNGTPIFRVTSDVEEINESNIIPHSTLYLNGTNELHIMDWDNLAQGKVDRLHERFVRTDRFKKESGMVISYNSANGSIIAEPGKYWYGAIRKSFSLYNSIDDNLRFYYHSAGEWVWDDTRNDIEITKIDNGTDLVNIPKKEYVNIYIYTCCEDNLHKLYYFLGNRCKKLADAYAEKIPSKPPFLISHGVLLCILTFQEGVLEPIRTLCNFNGDIQGSIPTKHSDLSGLTTGDTHPALTIYTDTTNFDNLLSTEDDDVQKALDVLDDHKHEDYKQYSGFENRTDSEFGEMTTDEFSISPTNFENGYNVYCGGEKFNIQETLTINLITDRRIHYIFFNYNSGAPYLEISLSPWEIKNINFSPVAIVFKDGPDYALTDERHSYNRNVDWHDWAHDNIGTMYNSGLTGVFTNTTFSIEQGRIADEDIRFDTGETKTTTSLWRRDTVANQMRMERGSTTIYKTNGTDLLWDNNGVETPAGNNTFLAYHVYCSNDPVEPIYTVLPQAQYSNLRNAENSPKPEIRFSTAEWKLIYRAIYRNTATPSLVEVNDFRAVQTGSPISIVANEHNSLINRDAPNSHPSIAISVDSETLVGKLAGFTGTNLQELIEYIDANF